MKCFQALTSDENIGTENVKNIITRADHEIPGGFSGLLVNGDSFSLLFFDFFAIGGGEDGLRNRAGTVACRCVLLKLFGIL